MPEPTTSVALRAQREETIRALCDHFAADRLEVAEFEHRLDLAHRALTPAELAALTTDLAPAAAPTAAAPSAVAPAPARAVAHQPTGHQLVVGLMGGATRRGAWAPARETTAISIMGGVMLDFREAQLPPGETVVHAFAFWGGVGIVVPPELEVAVNGIGIMGGFGHRGPAPGKSVADVPDAPRLRIDGVALMGGVDVQVKAAGEPTAWDNAHVGVTAGHGSPYGTPRPPHMPKHELRERRRQIKEEARRLKDEWRSRR